MTIRWSAVAGFVLAVTASGCATPPPDGLLNKEPASVQRRQAAQVDPYPAPMNGPSMDGVRPRDYQQPYTPELRDYMDKNEPGWATQGRYPSPQPSPQPGLQLTPQPGPQLAPQPAPQ